MHLRSRNLPRPSASSPLDNRAPPMANASQIPDLEGLHHEIHGMAEQMRVMNENDARLIQLLAAANPSPQQHRPSLMSSDLATLIVRGIVLTTQTRSRVRRGRNPHRGDRTRARDKSTAQKIRDLDARLDAINTGTNAPITVDALVRQTDPPFTERVLRTRISSKFKLPTQLGIYEGKTDPMDHLDSYKSLMSLQGCSDEVMCKAFSATLKGPARSWFRKLSPGTVDSFGELSRLFVANFMSCRNRQKNASHLFTVHQKETESLKDFVKRFNQAVLDVEDPSDKVIIMAMMEGLRPDPLFDSLSKNVPETLSALQSKADKGYLRKYITDRPPPDSPERKYGDNRPTAGNIKTIHGGYGSGGCSTSSRKRHARSAFRSVEEEVYNLSSPCVSDQPPITFSSDDLRGLHLPHDDALVVSAVIANFNVQRILIDSGSSADILFISAFEKMKIGLDKLHPFHTPLIGFGGNTTHPLGWINLPITLGTEPQQTTVWQDFIVVDCPSPYNSILGATYAGKNQGDHLYLPPEDEIPHLNWNRRSKGRSKGDVPGIDPEVAMHKLFTKPDYSPVRQKRRKFALERLKVIEDEISKLIKANVVREAHYPDWLANVVVAPKKGGKWKWRSTPPLSMKLLSFMDAFSGYHQIKMYPPDVEKTSFITERGLYCYKVMPFGLKNAGATYQRLVNKMFNAQIGKDYGRFLVTKRGIEVNPDQIQALIAMRSPRNIREVQQLTGRVAALNRFVSKSTDKCLPFFKILRKSQTFQWSEESENAFQQLKEYLGSPPLLSVPTANEDLYVYLSASPTAISAVLIREEDRIQKPIYYAHSIIVLTDQPLKQILQRPDTSGKLLKWSIELSEFHIEYKPRTAIKAQALSDFIVESTHEDIPQPETTPLEAGIPKEPTSEQNLAHWILYVDGSSNQHGCGAGLVLRAPSGEQMDPRRLPRQGLKNDSIFGRGKDFVRKDQGIQDQPDSREDNKKADALANLASTFEFISLTGPLLRCLRPEEAEYVLREIHEGICGNHSGARSLAKKIIRQGYFWPTMERDAATFGVPKVIISDNARQFDNDRFRLFCSDLAISHHFSSPGHPQANGQVEVTNRTILRNLKARLERSKSEWAEDLPSIIWAYHTTSRIPTGETPYSMVFGTESVIPVEIGVPSFRTLNFNGKDNEGELKLNLDLLDEKRESAELRQAAYKSRIAKYYNERVKHRSFLPGDLVLRRVTLSTRDPSAGKLGPTWEGPYKVIKVSRPGTCWLEDPNGETTFRILGMPSI
ncbi:hypothetical protein Acr_18g0011650 [Actinidia rufa]|uniref:Integrase catalytic domain-containing protein n=1 Tax=Actinidia rufa TaxID=165716 RepID=A0A7J0G862_9ERIC|nr:hypothetical protein Acr_18g0011650 [Actinidia rufa]